MLKVVLVDDEEIIRDGIYAAVDWETLGCEVVAQADDGEQALRMIEETGADVIITDIKMPFIDGLELIERVKPKYPGIYIIIISGHDEFHFAQKALKLGAFDYILKPIEIDYLKEILLKIRSDYELRNKKELEVDSLREKLASNLPLLQERFFGDLLSGKVTGLEITKKLEELKIGDSGNYFAVLIAQIDDYYLVTQDLDDQQRNRFDQSFDLMIKDGGLSEKTIFVLEGKAGERIIAVATDYDPQDLEKAVVELCEAIHRKTGLMGENFTVTVAIGTIGDTLGFLAKSYQEALEALNYKYILGKNRDIYFKDLHSVPKKEFYDINYNESELISAIKMADKKLVRERLRALTGEIHAEGDKSYLYMQIMVSSIYRQALKLLHEVGGAAEEVFNNPLEVYNRILAFQTAGDMIGELSNVLLSIIDYIDIKRSGKFDQVIEKSKEFISQNYVRDDLSLADVAKYVNMSICYFSFIFKQEMGLTFIDYLTGKRIEKAKELLTASGYKSYEISYLVGYNNPTYFSTIFKKHTGVSPTEYRGSHVK
jgi:two-component system, response regulator YesN